MIEVKYEGYDTIVAYGLTQYDYGQLLHFSGFDIVDGTEIHFCQHGKAITQYIQSNQVQVPDYMLQYSEDIQSYIYEIGQSSGRTVKKITLHVSTRERPGDYVEPEEPAYARLLPLGGKDGQYLKIAEGEYVWASLDDGLATDEELTELMKQVPVPITNLELEKMLD